MNLGRTSWIRAHKVMEPLTMFGSFGFNPFAYERNSTGLTLPTCI
jgi:hypothetical protein